MKRYEIEEEMKRVESSIPVQSRVSMIDLARIDLFFVREGMQIRTLSGIVNRAINLLCEVLVSNDKMPGDVSTVAQAVRYLEMRGLHQKSLTGKTDTVARALRFESMREEGLDPKNEDPMGYMAVYGGSLKDRGETKEPVVKMSQEEVRAKFRKEQHTSAVDDEEWNRIQERLKEERKVEQAQIIQNAKDSGTIVKEGELDKLSEEEFIKQRQAIDKEIIEKENAPLSEEDKARLIVKK
jgi:hypothetical protein